MSTTMRLCAATASITFVSAALGYGLAATTLAANENNIILVGAVQPVESPASSRENLRTRSVSGLELELVSSRSIAMSNAPSTNRIGPRPGDTRVYVGRTRSLQPACLVAFN